MDYIYVKNLEKYHPGYKDRTLVWCKVYFTMMNGDPKFEMLEEIDQWRFVKLIMLQLQVKNGVPLDDTYLIRKGFDTRKRPISLTLKMLHEFIEIRNESVTQSRVYKEEEYKEEERRSVSVTMESFFEPIWIQYPLKSRVGKKNALRHFNASVKTTEDLEAIQTALKNYLECENVKKGYVKNASTWFNEWRDWVGIQPASGVQKWIERT